MIWRAKSELARDAGSGRTRRVRARPRTQRSEALQPPGRETTFAGEH